MRLYVALLALRLTCVVTTSDDEDSEEIVIDEVVDDHTKQHLLVDRNYNSSFTISVPMLTVLVPGTSRVNGIIRFSVSHLTLWTLVSGAFIGLVYPIFLGPHGKLHKRSFHSRGIEPTFLDHLETMLNVSQLIEDAASIIPYRLSQQCFRKTICEAHEQAEQFGVAGLAIRTTYPAARVNVFGNEVQPELKKAAEHGVDSERSCKNTYSDCRLSPRKVYREACDFLAKHFADDDDDDDDDSSVK